jgi:hypothetical protein
MAKRDEEIIELLWESLKRDREHKDRRLTGWGTKTKVGLVACVERIFTQPLQGAKFKLWIYPTNELIWCTSEARARALVEGMSNEQYRITQIVEAE